LLGTTVRSPVVRRGLWILIGVTVAVIAAIVAVFVGSLVRTHQKEVESAYDAVYVVSVDGSGLRKLTSDKRDHQYVWSPDGRQIVAQSDTAEAPNSLPGPIELMAAGGGAVREVHAAGFAFDPAWRSERALELLDTASVSEIRPTRILELSLPGTVRLGRSIGPIGAAAWSPAGGLLAIVPCRGGSYRAIELLPAIGQPARRLGELNGSLGPGVCLDPTAEADEALVWAPAGHSLYVRTSRGLWRYRLAGGPPELVEPGSQKGFAATVSPDGKLLVTEGEGVRRGNTVSLLYLRPAAGGRKRLLTAQPGSAPVWSPDGAAVAFVSGSAIYTAPLAGGPARKVVGLSGDDISDLSWSPDGRRLGFVASVETPQT
jgi:dipeptidyl aminopeptidase/acylaminoacyl peptidase